MSKGSELETISVEAALTETGLSASATSRAVTAIDRLFGFFGVDLQSREMRRGAQADIEQKVILARGEKLVRAIQDDDPRAGDLAAGVISEGLRKRLNLQSIGRLAIEDLRENADANQDSGTDKPYAEEEDFQDWLNVWMGFAEKASSDRLQELWASILAGQIRNGTAFGYQSLRVLSELDQRRASQFQAAIEHFRFKSVLLKQKLSGQQYLDWKDLEDAGFISPSDSSMEISYLDGQNVGGFIGVPETLLAEFPDSSKRSVSVQTLTQAGREIASLLPRPSSFTALRAFANDDVFKSAKWVKLAVASHGNGNRMNFTFVETLRDSS